MNDNLHIIFSSKISEEKNKCNKKKISKKKNKKFFFPKKKQGGWKFWNLFRRRFLI